MISEYKKAVIADCVRENPFQLKEAFRNAAEITGLNLHTVRNTWYRVLRFQFSVFALVTNKGKVINRKILVKSKNCKSDDDFAKIIKSMNKKQIDLIINF